MHIEKNMKPHGLHKCQDPTQINKEPSSAVRITNTSKMKSFINRRRVKYTQSYLLCCACNVTESIQMPNNKKRKKKVVNKVKLSVE